MKSDQSPTLPPQNSVDDYPPPPPPGSSMPPPAASSSSADRRSPLSRDRSMSPPPHRSSSRDRYYDDRRSYRDDDRYGHSGGRDRYDGPRRDYYEGGRGDRYDRGGGRYDRYDRYDHRDRYDRYDRRDRYDDRRGRYPPRSRPRRPVERGTAEDRKNATTIYAGNLPYDFTERDVATMFERYGRIKSVTIPLDRNTNKNKGFAFVEFEDRRDAEDAFEKFDGFSVEGRRLRLDWDIGLNKKDPGQGSRRFGSGAPPAPPLDERDRGLNDPYAAPPPPPPPMDSRGYRRSSPEPYRR